MSIWQKLFGKHLTVSCSHVGPEPVKYFQVNIPSSPKYLCSDKACPCPGTERLVPGKTGFVYISQELVQLRQDTLTYKEFMEKVNRDAQKRGVMVFLSQGVYEPLFMCKEAAMQRGLDLTVAAADAAYMFKHGWSPLRPTPRKQEGKVYLCDICGDTFSRARLDEHFAETAKQVAVIKGIAWSGKLVTFDENGKAWCPHCFKDVNSMRSGTRTVHEGMKSTYLRPPNIELKYQCKCGRDRTFNLQSVNIYTGAEVECGICGEILWVPPTIFDHSKPSLIGEASLCSDYKNQITFVKCSRSELNQQFTKGVITEQEYKEELKRRGA
jgi:hypothetical protein